MKTRIFSFFTVLAFTGLLSCSSSKTAIVPLTAKAQIEDTYTIIWNGLSEAYRFTDGQWKRDETYDYVFDVIQKRYPNQWKSTKNMHRLHPDYDGRGGARDQAMYFEINFTAANDQLQSIIHASLEEGSGKSDKEFREQQIVLQVKDVSSFSPYNKIRITQHYQYESGTLRETVELLKEKNGQDTPFMKMEEKAYFYVRGKLDKAPTVY